MEIIRKTENVHVHLSTIIALDNDGTTKEEHSDIVVPVTNMEIRQGLTVPIKKMKIGGKDRVKVKKITYQDFVSSLKGTHNKK